MLSKVQTSVGKVALSKAATSKAVVASKRSFASANKDRNDLLVNTAKKIGTEFEKAQARDADKLFYELFPEAVDRTDEEDQKQMREFFTTVATASKDFLSRAPSAALNKALIRFNELASQAIKETTANVEPVKVAVTGASGQIGYALLFRIASGQMFGPNTPVILNLLELPAAMNSLKGVIMELQDCAFPLVRGINAFDDAGKAFTDIDHALLVGARPRTKGMERGDLLMANAEIFSAQGKALNQYAKKTVKVSVVGNPANTNAMIAQRNAPSIPAENFTAMTRLDHNRGLAQLSLKTGAHVKEIDNFAIWGNHSATQYPSIAHATIRGEVAAKVINDDKWVTGNFIPDVQQRGAAIIAARGASSAASAAGALVDHVHDWVHGTRGEWTSMAVISKGEYGVEPGLCFSYPVVTSSGKFAVVENLPIDPFSAERLEKTHQELKQERDGVAKLLPK